MTLLTWIIGTIAAGCALAAVAITGTLLWATRDDADEHAERDARQPRIRRQMP